MPKISSPQHHMRKFLKIFLRSLGTYLGVGGGLARPLVMVGFHRKVISITHGVDYIGPQADSLVYFLLITAASVHMWTIK